MAITCHNFDIEKMGQRRGMACNIDWIAAGTWMQAAAGFAGAAAVVWVGNGTKNAFGTWLQQKQTERRLDVAERLLFLVNKVDDVFRKIREPSSFGDELDRARNVLNNIFDNKIPEDRKHRLEICQTILNRISYYGDFWTEYDSLKPQVRAYFGEEFFQSYEKIGWARVKISAAAKLYANMDPVVMERNPERALKQSDSYEAIFWDGWANALEMPDEIADSIGEAKAKAEEVVRPLLAVGVDRWR